MLLISVIVPVYKVEQYIEDCINSILQQTYHCFELLLVDDGSPDACGSICDAYSNIDSRIRVIHKQNGGLSDARNAGLMEAKGVYVTFVDGDDYIYKYYLETMVNAAQEFGADIVQGELTRKPEMLGNKVNVNLEKFSGIEAFKQCVLWKRVKVYAWNKLYKTKLFENVKFPVGRINEDSCTFYKLFFQANCVVCIPNIIYFYRNTPGSIMNSPIDKTRFEVLKVPEEMKIFFGEYASKYEKEISYYKMRLSINLYNESILNGMQQDICVQQKILLKELQKMSLKNTYFEKKYKMMLCVLRILPKVYEVILKIGKSCSERKKV